MDSKRPARVLRPIVRREPSPLVAVALVEAAHAGGGHRLKATGIVEPPDAVEARVPLGVRVRADDRHDTAVRLRVALAQPDRNVVTRIVQRLGLDRVGHQPQRFVTADRAAIEVMKPAHGDDGPGAALFILEHGDRDRTHRIAGGALADAASTLFVDPAGIRRDHDIAPLCGRLRLRQRRRAHRYASQYHCKDRAHVHSFQTGSTKSVMPSAPVMRTGVPAGSSGPLTSQNASAICTRPRPCTMPWSSGTTRPTRAAVRRLSAGWSLWRSWPRNHFRYTWIEVKLSTLKAAACASTQIPGT